MSTHMPTFTHRKLKEQTKRQQALFWGREEESETEKLRIQRTFQSKQCPNLERLLLSINNMGACYSDYSIRLQGGNQICVNVLENNYVTRKYNFIQQTPLLYHLQGNLDSYAKYVKKKKDTLSPKINYYQKVSGVYKCHILITTENKQLVQVDLSFTLILPAWQNLSTFYLFIFIF